MIPGEDVMDVMDVAPRCDGWCAPSTSSSVAPAGSPGAKFPRGWS